MRIPGDGRKIIPTDIMIKRKDEFLMCAALKTAIVQVFMKEKQKPRNVREDKTPLVHYVTFVFPHKDLNLISKLHT